jgi:hypothetical protein
MLQGVGVRRNRMTADLRSGWLAFEIADGFTT